MAGDKLIHVLVTSQFIDVMTGEYRYAGDEFDVTEERMEQINNAGYGKLVVAYNDKSFANFGRKSG